MPQKISHASLVRTLIWALATCIFLITQYFGQRVQFIEVFPDSTRYFPPTPLFSLENAGVFYSGFVRAVEGFPGILNAQVALSAITWSVLSFALLNFFSSWIGLIASLLTLFVAIQEPVTSWNNLLLSESVAISVCAIWLAALIFTLKEGHKESAYRIKLMALFVTSALLVLNRPQAIIVVLPACLSLLVFPVTSISRKIKFGFIAGIVSISVFSYWRILALAFGSPFSSAYGQHLVENRIPFTSFALQMSGCETNWGRISASYSALVQRCPNLGLLNEEHKISFTSWLLAKPIEALVSFFDWIIQGATFVSYSSSPTLIDEVQANSLLGIGTPMLQSVGNISLICSLFIVISGLLYGFRFSIKRFALSLGFIFLMFIYVFVAWGVDGIEMPRHSLPILLFIPLIFAFCILYCFEQDRALTLRRRFQVLKLG